MRQYLPFYIITVLLFLNCTNKKLVSDADRYGNTFIHIGYNDFNAPDNWVTHKLFDKAFQIKLPPFYISNAETAHGLKRCRKDTNNSRNAQAFRELFVYL